MKAIRWYLLCLMVMGLTTSSVAQIDWERYKENPTLQPGSSGEWDASLGPGCVLYDGETYHNWYAGAEEGVNFNIGHATSSDGTVWIKDTLNNPVLKLGAAGTWEDERISDPYVLFIDDMYHMWYGGYNGQHFSIGYATSPDGVTWTKYENNPVLVKGPAGSWMEKHVFSASVRFDGSTFHMWFSGENEALIQGIGYATSEDGIDWTLFKENPVLKRGAPGEWDQRIVQAPAVVFDGHLFHMWFNGIDNPNWWGWQIGYAISPDETSWIKYAGNPVLRPSASGWDSQFVGFCSAALDTVENEFRMWYGGGDGAYSAKGGYATAPQSILHVPAYYETIQEGIDAADSGDVVLVDEGTYYENINFKGKAITVASHYWFDSDTSHISNTIIDGSQPANPDSGSVVYFISGEDTLSVLTGLTITNGTGTKMQYTYEGETSDGRAGAGIYGDHSGCSIISNKIINNTITTEHNGIGCGIGIGEFGSDSYVIIEDNTIMNNTINTQAVGTGGGITITCNGRIVHNVITHNSCISTGNEAGGGGIRTTTESKYPRTVTIKGNTIAHNFVKGKGTAATDYWASEGAGILNTTCTVLILNNHIFNNVLKSDGSGNGLGAGIYTVYYAAGSKIDGNTIYNNINDVSGIKYGGGISVGTSTAIDITNNIIFDNQASHGGGIRIYNNNAQIINNTIVDNTASSTGGGIQVNNSNPIVFNTILWGNEAENNAQIYGTATVRYSNIQGGRSGEGNIDLKPKLIVDNPDYPAYFPHWSSPCVDKGVDSIIIGSTTYYAPEHCYCGTTRPFQDGVDMGAIEWDGNAIEGYPGLQPEQFALRQNYPNPFNPETTIEFTLASSEFVQLKVYNILGRHVSTLVSKRLTQGTHMFRFTGTHLASGIYFYQLLAGDYEEVKKMILLH